MPVRNKPHRTPESGPPRVTWQSWSWIGVLVIAGLTCFAYFPSLGGDRLLDDDALVFDNPLIKAPDGLYRIWLTTEPADYWPLTNTSFWIEWRLWETKTFGYHFTNLVLHIAASLVLWWVLRKLSVPGAFLGALLFALHPVNVESVAWIAQRKNLLAILFYLLSIGWYLRADAELLAGNETGGEERRRRRSTPSSGAKRWYWLSLIAFSLGMLSKGSIAILPVVVLLLIWWRRGRVTQVDFARIAPFLVVAVVLTGVNMWFQTHGNQVLHRNVSFLDRLLGAPAVVWFYLGKALAPVRLAYVYPQWNIVASDVRWWLPLMAAIVVTVALWWQRNRGWGRALLAAWAYFCVALVPVMGFTDVGYMRHSLVADHYQQLALIGVVAVVGAALESLYQRAAASARWGGIALTSGVVAGMTLLCWQQSTLYASAESLLRDTIEKTPESSLAECILAYSLYRTERAPEALAHYERAVSLDPENASCLVGLGQTLVELHRSAEAMPHFQRALELDPDSCEAHNALGHELSISGRYSEACGHFEKALQSKTDSAFVHNNYGETLAKMGRTDDAVAHLEKSIRLKPDFAAAHNNLGNLMAQGGELPKAIEQYQEAVRLKPDFAEAQYNLHNNQGIMLGSSRKMADAIAQFKQAVRWKPEFADAYANLALAYARSGQSADALAAGQKAIELARSQGDTSLAQRMEAWLAAFPVESANGKNDTSDPQVKPSR